MSETKRTAGPVTLTAGVGAGAGAAAAAVVVWALAQFGVDATAIEWALGALFAAAGAVFGGWLVKPGTGARRAGG